MRQAAFRLLPCVLLLAIFSQAEELEDLRLQVAQLRKEMDEQKKEAPPKALARAEALTGDYGPSLALQSTTKLEIGALLQVWYQMPQQDRVGIVATEPNYLNDHYTFRTRRSELHFLAYIHEHIAAYVMIDPARESNIAFTPLPTFPVHNNIIAPVGKILNGPNTGPVINPQLLQDAYLNFYGVVPHHDFIGQFKPPSGEESWRDSGQLDFIERAMATGINNVRDIGAMAHGTWIENRVQYWVGVFNGPSGTVLADPEIVEGGNRPSDHQAKDLAWRVALHPVWNAKKWFGRLETGYARTDGYRGKDGQGYDPTLAGTGLNRESTKIYRQAAWLWYRPGNEARGWWLRGEWCAGRDRYDPIRNPTDLLGLGSVTDINDNVLRQADPAPVTVMGWYCSTGYKLSDSVFKDTLAKGGPFCRFLRALEFAFRFETYQNVATERPGPQVVEDRETDLFSTKVVTFGVNYYFPGCERGHAVKIQINYFALDDPYSPSHGLRKFDNNVLAFAFQVKF